MRHTIFFKERHLQKLKNEIETEDKQQIKTKKNDKCQVCKEDIAKEYNRNYSREIIKERGPKNRKTSWKTSDGENGMNTIRY